MIDDFLEVFERVKSFLCGEGLKRKKVVGINMKGHKIREFDHIAEKIAIDELRKRLNFPFRILTEERGLLSFGRNPELTFIIDPVDGSTNYMHGVGVSSFAIAAISGALRIKSVQYALVGSIFSDEVFTAQQGRGAFLNGRRIKSSGTKKLSEAYVIVDCRCKKESEIKCILPIFKAIGNFRKFGSASYEICCVAAGKCDARIDLRHELTAENFMAASLILREAGGIFTDERGKDFGVIKDLKRPYNNIASANKILLKEILRTIGTLK